MTGYGGADRNFHWGSGTPPSIEREINVNFEAGALINKAAANIVAEMDTIDAQALIGMPYGRNNSEPNKPILQFPFISFRVLKRGPKQDNKEFEMTYKSLLKNLPRELKEKLNNQMNLSIATRDPVYSGLDKTLSLTAMTMIWLEKIAKPFKPNSKGYQHAEDNLHLTDKAIQNLILQGERVIRDGLIYLKKMGKNNPQYYSLLQFLKDIAQTIKLLKKILGQSDDSSQDTEEEMDEEEEVIPKEKHQKPSMTYMKNAAAFIDTVNEQYHHKTDQEQLQMIGAVLKGISVLNSTQSLNAGLKSVLYGMITLHIGLDTSESEAAVIGSETRKYIDTYSKIMTETFLKDLSPGEKQLIPMLITSTTLITTTAALYLIDSDSHIEIESKDIFEDASEQLSDKDRILANVYALQNIINMLLTTDYFSSLVPKNKLIVKDVNFVAMGIELLITTLIIKVLNIRHPEGSSILLNGLDEMLHHRFLIMKEAFNSIRGTDLSEIGVDSRQIELATLHLSNCCRSLRNKDYMQYNRALNEFITSFSVNCQTCEKELELFYKLAETMKSSLAVDLEDYKNALTGITQI